MEIFHLVYFAFDLNFVKILLRATVTTMNNLEIGVKIKIYKMQTNKLTSCILKGF